MYFSTKLAKRIFFITAAALIFLSAILSIQLIDLIEANESVNKTNTVKFKLAEILSYTKDAETAQRGYMLTKDTLFLQPFQGAYSRVKNDISELENNYLEEAEERSRLKKLENLVDMKFSNFNAVINNYHLGQNDLEKKTILKREKALMDSMRWVTMQLIKHQDARFDKEDGQRKKHTIFAPAVAIILVFFSLTILSAAYYKIITDLKKSEEYLTQLHHLNKELAEKNRELQNSNEELDSFNYISSHDLQEPVRKIRTFVSLIESSDFHVLSEKGKNNFQRLQNAAIRIQNLLQDLLAYSQISKGEKKMQPVDLNKSIEQACQNLEMIVEETNAVVNFDQLPTVFGVPFQFEQLFENLLSNSLKYKQDGQSPIIKINYQLIKGESLPTAIATQAMWWHKISVRDNGIGFDDAYAEKIFEPFSRLHSRDGYPGTGIGLTICKKIVNNHNGHIMVHSRENDGATFEIYLPDVSIK